MTNLLFFSGDQIFDFCQVFTKEVTFFEKPFGFRTAVQKNSGYILTWVHSKTKREKGLEVGLVLKVINGQEVKLKYNKRKVAAMLEW